MRVWHDEDGSDANGVIRKGSRSFEASIGGHDIMNNLHGIFTGNAAYDSGHAGWPDITIAQALADLQAMGVPTGTHKMCLKYGHSGYTTATDDGMSLTFTISAGYTSLSDVATTMGRPNYDLALCSCVVGTDCPNVVD